MPAPVKRSVAIGGELVRRVAESTRTTVRNWMQIGLSMLVRLTRLVRSVMPDLMLPNYAKLPPSLPRSAGRFPGKSDKECESGFNFSLPITYHARYASARSALSLLGQRP